MFQGDKCTLVTKLALLGDTTHKLMMLCTFQICLPLDVDKTILSVNKKDMKIIIKKKEILIKEISG